MRAPAAIALTAGLLIGLMPATASAQAWRDRADEIKDTQTESADKWLEVVFNTGRVVYGKLVEETDDEITVMVYIEGLPPTRAVYQKNELIEIRRNLKAPNDGSLGGEDADESAPVLTPRSSAPDDFPTETETGGEINDETTKFYFASIEGDIGRSVTRTLLQRYFEDVDKVFNDLVEVPNPNGTGTIQVVDPEKRDKNIVVFSLDVSADPRFSYGYATNAVRRIGDLMEEQIDIKGRRVIYVVENTQFGGSLLIFTSPEVYFEPRAEMVGYGLADAIGQGADDVVREKWIGITLSAMTSIAHSRGYGLVGEHVVMAMARERYWFAYQMDGGKAVTTIYEPDNWANWVILSDDGEDEREDDDELDPNKTPGEQDIADRSVNPARDVLELNADDARRLGISKGTITSVEDLAFELGVERNYVEYASSRAPEIAARYWDDVQRNWERVMYPNGDLWEEYFELQDDVQNADSGSEQIRYLRQRIRIVRQVMSIVDRFDDIQFPVPSDPQMEIWIEQDTQQINRIRANR